MSFSENGNGRYKSQEVLVMGDGTESLRELREEERSHEVEDARESPREVGSEEVGRYGTSSGSARERSI